MKRLTCLIPLALACGLFVGCEDDNALERAGDKVEDAAEEVGDKIEDAADEVEDAVDDPKK